MIRVGILGLGTVGQAVLDILQTRLADRFEVVSVAVRDVSASRRIFFEGLTTDVDSVVSNPRIDVILECMGGIEPARTAVLRALDTGKRVVTANKALIASCWPDFQPHFDRLRFEASVAAAIPIVRTVRSLVEFGDVASIEGVMNGTTNFILTTMAATGRSFEDVLAEAQSLGYAEADPSSDVDGWDAAYKLSILSSIASSEWVRPESISVSGIRSVTPEMLEAAALSGSVLKLIARWDRESGASVGLQTLPSSHPLAGLEGVTNGIAVTHSSAGDLSLIGPGAGGSATASAMVTDLLELVN